jgi:2-oxoglutarate dehydrogenase E2 component (dihydrolipoamide succinyltransferase)
VLKNVEKMSLVDISHDIATLAGKARAGKLKPEDLQGGTFSITSPGQLGASFAIPIINQQQGAILHFGAIQKVPAVITHDDGTDAIAIRQHAMLTLGIDHRLVDGWDADRFMSAVRDKIEKADFEIPQEIR